MPFVGAAAALAAAGKRNRRGRRGSFGAYKMRRSSHGSMRHVEGRASSFHSKRRGSSHSHSHSVAEDDSDDDDDDFSPALATIVSLRVAAAKDTAQETKTQPKRMAGSDSDDGGDRKAAPAAGPGRWTRAVRGKVDDAGTGAGAGAGSGEGAGSGTRSASKGPVGGGGGAAASPFLASSERARRMRARQTPKRPVVAFRVTPHGCKDLKRLTPADVAEAAGAASSFHKKIKKNIVKGRWGLATTNVKQSVRLQRTYVADAAWEPPKANDDSSSDEELSKVQGVVEAINATNSLDEPVGDSKVDPDAQRQTKSPLPAPLSISKRLSRRIRYTVSSRVADPIGRRIQRIGQIGPIHKCCKGYSRFARKVNRKIAQATWFKTFIMLVIGVAAVTVGMQTYTLDPAVQSVVTDVLEPIVQWVFVGEAIVMLISFGKRFWGYFKDAWNVFDFIIVVSSFLPIGASQVTTLRLLRLLRLLKLVKALPKLRMLVLGLLNSLSSIGYISMLLGLLFYLYAVLGVITFSETDPYYFGTLDRALVSLWQSATGDDWSDHLYTGIYGCNAGEASDPAYQGPKKALCTGGEAFGFLLPTIYFLSFQMIAALMVLNLFVGAILMAVQDAKDELDNGDVLTVTVVRAEDLEVADGALMGGASDPFVQVVYGTESHTTKVKKNNLNPVWKNATFDFLMEGPDDERPDVITFQVFDWDRFSANDLLGDFHLKISSLPYDREFTFRMELNNTSRGWLTVRVLKHALGPPTEEKSTPIRQLEYKVETALDVLEEMMDVGQSIVKKKRAEKGLLKRLSSIRKQVSRTISRKISQSRWSLNSGNTTPKMRQEHPSGVRVGPRFRPDGPSSPLIASIPDFGFGGESKHSDGTPPGASSERVPGSSRPTTPTTPTGAAGMGATSEVTPPGTAREPSPGDSDAAGRASRLPGGARHTAVGLPGMTPRDTPPHSRSGSDVGADSDVNAQVNPLEGASRRSSGRSVRLVPLPHRASLAGSLGDLSRRTSGARLSTTGSVMSVDLDAVAREVYLGGSRGSHGGGPVGFGTLHDLRVMREEAHELLASSPVASPTTIGAAARTVGPFEDAEARGSDDRDGDATGL